MILYKAISTQAIDEAWIGCKQCSQEWHDMDVYITSETCPHCNKPLEVAFDHMSQFKEMIEPKQSYHINERFNAVIISEIIDSLDLWMYFDKITGEFKEMRVE